MMQVKRSMKWGREKLLATLIKQQKMHATFAKQEKL